MIKINDPLALLEQIQQKESIKALFFDLDGTLVDSEKVHFKAFAMALGEKGIQSLEDHGITLKELAHRFRGMADQLVYDKLSQMTALPFKDYQEMRRAKEQAFQDALKSFTHEELFHPEILNTLTALKKYFSLSLVTASNQNDANATIGHCDLGQYFEQILTRNDTEKTKPHPMPYLKAMENLGFKPSESAVVEDSPPGLESALAAQVELVIHALWYG